MYAVVGVYAVICWMLSVYLGEYRKYHPFQYVLSWAALNITLLMLIWAARAIWADPRLPFSSFVSLAKQEWHQGLAQRLPLIFVTGIFLGVFTSAKSILSDIHPFAWDPALAEVDYRIFGGHDGWKIAAAIVPDGLPLRLMDMFYSNGWAILILSFNAYASLASDLRHLRQRFSLAFYFSWIMAGNILACIFMSGGPCFYAKLVGNPRFSGLIQSISATEAAEVQNYLWTIYLNHKASLGAGISAFPSVHMVSITLIMLLMKSMGRAPFLIGLALTALMELGSVRLGWHYAIDGFTGIAIAAGIWYFVQFTEKSFARRAL